MNVKIIVEGEEEVGSDTLPALLNEHKDKLEADVIVIADSGNWDIGEPALTTSLRGLVRMYVEVRTLDHGVHSGMWGGVVPDALMTLARLLSTLHDDDGNVAVEGLFGGPAADVEYPEDRARGESGIADGVDWIGDGLDGRAAVDQALAEHHRPRRPDGPGRQQHPGAARAGDDLAADRARRRHRQRDRAAPRAPRERTPRGGPR